MLKTDAITHTFRKPVVPPPWWEGKITPFREYPFNNRGYGFRTLKLSYRDTDKHQRAPYEIGQRLRCLVGGTWMYGEVSEIDILRPGWSSSYSTPCEFDPKKDPGDWKITVSFPGIPKP